MTATVALAQAGALTEITNITLAGLLPQEFKAIGTVILETKSSFTNATKSRIRSTSDGGDYIDFRTVQVEGTSGIGGGGTTSVFSDERFELFDGLDPTKKMQFLLDNITAGNTRVLTIPDASGTIALTDVAQTISAVNTFTASPIVPTPTTDYQASTKKYVDDKATTLDKKLTQAIVYYPAPNDDQFKQIKLEYLKNSALFYEQRFEYTAGAVTREEVKDDANGYWFSIDYTVNPFTYTVITAWTITI